MGCLKLTYRQEPDFRVIYSTKELTLKNSSQKAYSGYLYGFNGQEKTDEIAGSGNHYTAQFWEMDPRIGRRWERDPVVKHHESPYAILGNNPIWFVDLNGADSSLYNSKTGSFIAKGVTPEKDKTAIWQVDTDAEGYDKDNPWKTATKVTYTIGQKQKTGVGKNNLRKNHPLAGKGWTYGAQVFEEDLLDMTTEFNKLLTSEKDFFKKEGEGDYFGYGWSPGGYVDKMTNWTLLVNTDRPYDLKSQTRNNLTKIPSYAAVMIGQYSFYNGRLMNQDDYGNLSYGYWGKSYGYGLSTLKYGASWAQMFSSGRFDPPRDAYMLKLGFDMNK